MSRRPHLSQGSDSGSVHPQKRARISDEFGNPATNPIAGSSRAVSALTPRAPSSSYKPRSAESRRKRDQLIAAALAGSVAAETATEQSPSIRAEARRRIVHDEDISDGDEVPASSASQHILAPSRSRRSSAEVKMRRTEEIKIALSQASISDPGTPPASFPENALLSKPDDMDVDDVRGIREATSCAREPLSTPPNHPSSSPDLPLSSQVFQDHGGFSTIDKGKGKEVVARPLSRLGSIDTTAAERANRIASISQDSTMDDLDAIAMPPASQMSPLFSSLKHDLSLPDSPPEETLPDAPPDLSAPLMFASAGGGVWKKPSERTMALEAQKLAQWHADDATRESMGVGLGEISVVAGGDGKPKYTQEQEESETAAKQELTRSSSIRPVLGVVDNILGGRKRLPSTAVPEFKTPFKVTPKPVDKQLPTRTAAAPPSVGPTTPRVSAAGHSTPMTQSTSKAFARAAAMTPASPTRRQPTPAVPSSLATPGLSTPVKKSLGMVSRGRGSATKAFVTPFKKGVVHGETGFGEKKGKPSGSGTGSRLAMGPRDQPKVATVGATPRKKPEKHCVFDL
ncbi:hypothetical protein BOTBODRAFT_285528 [Botryobasidium botryosum FD-172 SS1]|uniref:Uncharacterized protein n=1 Tax=Botryobasidium botryosum (strain FD-172 SS1) TaxID=930990 RepID=A0A067MUZ2_BOTB1|nr:hypothetical protein BOTBODRAFT_285528 [Botryobasidium botryosum FD-172 SS1]